MKKKIFFLILCILATVAADARKKDYGDPNDVWRKRKYLNLSWVNQTLSDPLRPGAEMKSDFGASLASGRTYYLHKQPIAGIMKFGFDWTRIDFNYSRYTDGSLFEPATTFTKAAEGGFDEIVTDDEVIGAFLMKDWGKNQLDVSMHFGLSLTVNPVDFLKINAYGRFAPTLSGLLAKGADEDLEEAAIYGGYGSLWIGGAAVSYKVISFGIETRWGTTNYRNFNLDMEEMDDGGKPSLLGDVRNPLKTNATRIYLSFRFK